MQPASKPQSNVALSDLAIFMNSKLRLESVLSSPRQTISISRCWGGSRRHDARCRLFARARPFLNHIKDAGYEENSNRAGCEHSTDYRRSHNLASHRTSAARGPQWNAAEDKCERCHQDRAQPQLRPFKSRVRQRFPVFVLILGELDNQDRVLRCQPNQHDQTDLRIDIAFDLHHVRRQKNTEENAAQPKHRKSSEDRHRRAEQYAERQRPALVKSSKNQEDEQ